MSIEVQIVHCEKCKSPMWADDPECVLCRSSLPPPERRLLVRRLVPHAILPTYATEGAAGLDLYAARDTTILPGATAVVPTGIALAIPTGWEGQVRPRSGLARDGLVAVLGTIDSDYRGEVGVILHNHNRPNDYRSGEWWVKAGERIAQLVLSAVSRVEVVPVEELGQTGRGRCGFGSTGR